MVRAIYILTFVVCYTIVAFGQSEYQNIDQPSQQIDTTTISKNGFFSLFKGKPGKAALLSLVIPGGGQVYNKSWWKVPLAIGLDATFVYVLINNRNVYKSAQDRYIMALESGDNKANLYRQNRNIAQKVYEYSYIYLIAGHILTVVDAFVDRHLQSFDISDDLSLKLSPKWDFDGSFGIKIAIPLQSNKTQLPSKVVE